MKRIIVKSSAGPYPVICGKGALAYLPKELAALGRFSSVHIVSSQKVWRATRSHVQRTLRSSGNTAVHLFDDSEARKRLSTVENISRQLSRAGADRHSLLIAVGGGVVGDVVGFVASSYLRGVSLVHVPTTLVAQVDSAIGGKTGVNLPEGKNLVGAFYPPKLVIADSQLLRTLPAREFRGGLAEVIKYGVIADAQLFAFLEKKLDAILRREFSALDHIVHRCAQIKGQIVSRDERESALREILNFGHTFGHALESVTKYRRFQHGEAVAWGMISAVLLGHEASVIRAADVSRIVALVQRIGPLPIWPSVSPKSLLATMYSDKKTREGKLRFVLATRIGMARTFDNISPQLIKRVLHYTPRLASAAYPGIADA